MELDKCGKLENCSNDENEIIKDSDEENEFQASVLGTKEFWEDSFQRDLHVYQQRYEIDDVWFGQESVDRVIKWLNCKNIDKSSLILDIGCGNGATLVALAKNGYKNLHGIDYVSSAIDLARAIAHHENVDINFQVYDFLQPINKGDEINTNASSGDDQATYALFKLKNNDSTVEGSSANENNHSSLSTTTEQDNDNNIINNNKMNFIFDICLDKGTYDAICLNPIDRTQQMIRYRENLTHVCRDGGLFLITSCNWTRDELVKQFETDFEVLDQIPTPTFQFGGKTGNRETVIVFKKKPNISDDL